MEPKSQALEESTLWHSLPVTEVEARLQSDHTVGLSSEDVRERQLRLGENKLPASRSVPWLLRLLSQFNQLLIWILFLAAIFSGYLGDWGEAVAILGIVLLNGLLGFFQEIRAERSIQALQQLTAPLARVRRGGRQCLVPAAELVPGDTVELEAGDKLPADCRVVSAFSVSVDEASLTGESVTVSKSAEELAPATPLVDRRNMFYSGTVVTSGKATAIVVATGVRTELGKIANLLESEPWKETPLQKRLRELGRVLLFACLAIVAVIFGLQLLRGGQILETLLFSISLAVAAVPEGLPVVVTVTLSIGLQRMAKRNAIIRSLPSVETLGSVSTICSDKTGTLTRNQMTVREVYAGDARYSVEGTGYWPTGQFFLQGAHGKAAENPCADPLLTKLMLAGSLCTNARLYSGTTDDAEPSVVGDPTEIALLVLSAKAGLRADGYFKEAEIPFDSNRKMMSVLVRDSGENHTVYSKGAVEAILGACGQERLGNVEVPLDDRRGLWLQRA
ncbi:MAG: HAD-IC family P-type ATPase, partial [Bdellovibrionales bacterium]|nr:HAD-IC family P-type ATPase [Bdellovibrionales bacterium]